VTRPRRSYEFPDGSVLSIDGRLRFEVRTGEAPHPRFLPHRRVRRYRLVDTGATAPASAVAGPYRGVAGEGVVWERTDKAVHPWPWCLYVHVDGTTAVLHADDTLRLCDPDGGMVAAVPVLAALQHDPRARPHLARTTAGLAWDPYPKGCFVVARGRLCFALRTFWGTRVIVDARTGARVAIDEGTVRAAEEAWALERLTRAVREDRELPFWTRFAGQEIRDVVAAAQLAGQLRIAAAVPLLRRLRHAEPGGSPEVIEDGSYRPGAGELDIRSYATARGRRAVQLALLRLGHDPGDRPAYLFFADRAWKGERFDPGPRPSTWVEALGGVRPGLQPRALLGCAGAPFHVCGDAWDYDVLDGAPRTIRVTWGRRGLARAQVVSPPEWVTGHARDGLE
jgi:hypothetical protein